LVHFGPVVVHYPSGEIRIGYYDDDEYEYDENGDEEADEYGDPHRAIVYFSEPPFLFDNTYELVRPSQLSAVDTDSLWRCRQDLTAQLAEPVRQLYAGETSDTTLEERFRWLLELAVVNQLLADRMLDALGHSGHVGGRRIFISHSSVDKRLAIALSVDLASHGHVPWLDEWAIMPGDSIPLKISEGLENCDFVLVLLSPNAVSSGWVQAEWMTKYWDEVTSREVRVIPVLLADCDIPLLLRGKKYADFRADYADGLVKLLGAIRPAAETGGQSSDLVAPARGVTPPGLLRETFYPGGGTKDLLVQAEASLDLSLQFVVGNHLDGEGELEFFSLLFSDDVMAGPAEAQRSWCPPVGLRMLERIQSNDLADALEDHRWETLVGRAYYVWVQDSDLDEDGLATAQWFVEFFESPVGSAPWLDPERSG
jgi:hypothetical protein